MSDLVQRQREYDTKLCRQAGDEIENARRTAESWKAAHVAANEVIERQAKEIEAIRTAVANYMGSEGCACCQGPHHQRHEDALGALLKVPKYDDGSGYNFRQFQTP